MHVATAARLGGCTPGRLLRDGDEIMLGDARWVALHTPGHAVGHICVYHADSGAIVLGDMVASEGTIVIATADGGDMATYLEQLRRLEALAPKLGLPAHGEPIDDPCATFRRYLAHRQAREVKVIAALRASPRATVEALVPSAYADTPAEVWPIAALSLEAHLAKLVAEGAAAEAGGHYWMK
jgi:glyoxylase-like metal-dependent hydrolase (beta-lactamase superfamily II)